MHFHVLVLTLCQAMAALAAPSMRSAVTFADVEIAALGPQSLQTPSIHCGQRVPLSVSSFLDFVFADMRR